MTFGRRYCWSFHTTQYDLNRHCHYPGIIFCRRFHTTQYDLNNPYAVGIVAGAVKFPYYIVRFKQTNEEQERHAKKSFHTTQYDLNIISFFLRGDRFLFPYYIVRFKLQRGSSKRLNCICFHTTQYDLNRNKKTVQIFGQNVSILHSTI